MMLATWNVNSLNVRLPQVLDWLPAKGPDILALQETKLTDDRFPAEAFREAGYHAVFSGQKTYNGVALLGRTPPADVIRDFPGLDDPSRRVIAATFGTVRVVNLYVVNGESVGSDKYALKLDWLAKVRAHLADELAAHPALAVMGDFNITPDDRDVHDPAAWKDQILCSEPERAALRSILDLGLKDTFRLFEQPERTFSWWDYRAAAFRRNMGLRIDLILASEPLAARCRSSVIDRAPRGNERPSDHAVAVAVFE